MFTKNTSLWFLDEWVRFLFKKWMELFGFWNSSNVVYWISYKFFLEFGNI